MLNFIAKGSCSSGTGRRSIIVIGCADVSSCVSAYRFRLARSFVAFPLSGLDSNICCRFEAVFGVPSIVLPRFVVFTSSFDDASSVSLCATAVPIFLPWL